MMILTMGIAAPLAFLLSYWDKKAEEARADARAFEGWAELIAEFGLDLDTDAQELSWRQSAHEAVDFAFDKAEATVKAVNLAKKTASTITKGLGYVAAGVALLAFAGVVLAVSATTMWIALPFVLTYAAAHNTVSAAKAVKAKVSEAKAKAEAAAAKAEAERLEAVKAEAKALGFVDGDEVKAMIADAIMAHEAKKHRFKVNPAFERKLRPNNGDLRKILVKFGTEDLSMHAQAVVKKAIDEMTLAEMREELQCGNKYNLRTLRAKVRAARANS
jgi:hypothetical protein